MSFIITGLNVLGFAIPIVFDILLLFDSLIYSIAAYCLQAFFEIARFNINSNSINGTNVVEAIMYRVMVLGGVYALFRLGISLINYIINPPDADTASKNGSKILKNTVIAILLLASSKFIFNFLYNFSTSVIDNGTIQQIIYGPEAEYPDYSEEQTSKSFVNGVFLILFKRGDDTTFTSDAAKAAVSHVASGEASILTLSDYAYSSDFHYIPILTTVVGIMLIYYFGSFAIELGVRLFKLFILQVISPIPIILSIDPKQNKKLSNFAKAYSGIYISLFIRIITVYMAFVLLNLIEGIFGQLGKLTDTATTGFISLDATFLVEILLIIACFQAAKELPKLIEEALGTKLGLGDAGKGFKTALMGSIGGTLGLMTGAVAGGISGGPGGIVAGGFSGAWNGATKGAAAKNAVALAGTVVGNTKGAYGTGLKVRSADGLFGYGLGKIDNFTGRNAGIKRKVAEAETKVNAYKDFEDAVYSDYAKQDYIDPITGNKIGKIGTIDDDGDVIAAREALRNYRENTSAPDPTNSSAVARYNNDIATLRNDIKKAEDAYKKKAFDWFESKSLDTRGNIKYNPNQYSSMSSSEKAHYELTRANNKKVLNKGTSADLKTEFDSQNKAAKKAQAEVKDQQKSDRYQHAENIK